MTGTIVKHDPMTFCLGDVAEIIDWTDDWDSSVSVDLLAHAFVVRAMQVFSHEMTPDAANKRCHEMVETAFVKCMEEMLLEIKKNRGGIN